MNLYINRGTYVPASVFAAARGEAASCRGKAARGEAAYNLVIIIIIIAIFFSCYSSGIDLTVCWL